MDFEFAIRLVVFEYLLPMQRDLRTRALLSSLRRADLHGNWNDMSHPAGLFEDMLRLSDELLGLHGHPTSYIYPTTMMHDDGRYDARRNVAALIDSPGPFVWDPDCPRRADPKAGVRRFKPGPYMAAGVIVNNQG